MGFQYTRCRPNDRVLQLLGIDGDAEFGKMEFLRRWFEVTVDKDLKVLTPCSWPVGD